ncbi:putative plasma membrane antiporter [Aspergillus clavatus NRRL 1]|uniref:Plasma membrane antiporter, putative n=1 Tax=Aspergillus clavatus (strain ATCC 1007 / CBS 513.65 / DSM 816 / NCTC 3887 / NRRL 1 / QM 1276 / 107) TaxID=344612 RepID=A1CT61_ASPCL|nr:plasma membrane antiporter, putative [Aspergillus clavatus NRRL 1]EAW06498.1 plasma membrane antiporter, putative [Aspergillus clavatus NRRL 1]
MLHPVVDVSTFNVVLSVLSTYILLFGFISLKIKQRWYLGEALPALLIGIAFGPVAAKLLKPSEWIEDDGDGDSDFTYAVARLAIGVQLVKVGYQLPKRYLKERFKEMTLCLLPLTAIGWLATSGCIMLMIPRVSFLSALIIGSCVACTDPILSQAIAKGPFADNYVRRPLREFISSEAGGNDGFGFPFLLFAVALLRYAETPENAVSLEEFDLARGIPDLLGTADTGRFGGGFALAMKHWAIEGVLYMIVMGSAYGAFIGYGCRKILNLASRRRWVDNESFSLMPMAIGLFIVGTCGCFGSDETLACFVAGNALNWDGLYHTESQARHNTFNSTLDSLLNAAIFMYLGAVMPWSQFQMPSTTGITVWRLVALGFLVLLLRRIPAILLGYRLMPKVCGNWREALFMGYFGPIGIGAVAYAEYTRRLFPAPGASDREINDLTAAITPVVYWLVLFSIIVHGLSVPILNALYKVFNVPCMRDHPVEILLLSDNEPVPNNSTVAPGRHSMIVNNRFSRSPSREAGAEAEDDDEQVTLCRSEGSCRHALAKPYSSESSKTDVDMRDIV